MGGGFKERGVDGGSKSYRIFVPQFNHFRVRTQHVVRRLRFVSGVQIRVPGRYQHTAYTKGKKPKKKGRQWVSDVIVERLVTS